MLVYAQARALLKRVFDGGRVPVTQIGKFPIQSTVTRNENDGGDDLAHAMIFADPQAAGADFGLASQNFYGTEQAQFQTPMVKHYSLCRIDGMTMERAKRAGNKAFADLLITQTERTAVTEMKDQEIYISRNGSGMKGQFAAGTTLTGTTFTLRVTDDVINFNLNERLDCYDAETVAATQRVGTPRRITGLVRNPDVGQITLDGAINTWTSVTTNDFLCRAGDGPAGGVARVISGWDEWVVGGTTPGTFNNVNRNLDPVSLAGQQLDATNRGMESAVIDAEALLGYVAASGTRVLVCNSRDGANLKKIAASRMVLDRMESSVAGLSFQVVKMAGDQGDIRIIMSPFIRRGRAYLGTMQESVLDSIGPIPRLLHWNSDQVLNVAQDDAAEIRMGSYLRHRVRSPHEWVRILNFGV